MQVIKEFSEAEGGAVTVDWIVLCAAVVGIGFFTLIRIGFATDSAAVGVADNIAEQPVGFWR
jgi:hypothetical protein